MMRRWLYLGALVFTLDARAIVPEFNFEECHDLLTRPRSTDEAALRDAEELLSWMTMRHPSIRALLLRKPKLEIAFDLFFLTTGFHFPPKSSGISLRNDVVAHWRRALKPSNFSPDLGPPRRASVLGAMIENVFQRGEMSSERRDRIAFMAVLLEDSFRALKDVAWRINRSPGIVRGFPQLKQMVILRSAIDRDLKTLSFHWLSSFSEDELDQLYKPFERISNVDVRSHLVHLLDGHLEGLASEQRAMCARLKRCDTIEGFLAVYADVKRDKNPKRNPAEASNFASLAGAHAPVNFDRADLLAYLATAEVGGEPAAAQAPLVEIMLDLNKISRVLGAALSQLDAWRGDRFEWSEWSHTLVPTMPALDQLRFDLDLRSAAIAAARDQFVTAGQDFARLRHRAERLNERFAAYEFSEDNVKALSPDRRLALQSILSTLPIVRGLTERATEAVERRQTVMVRELAVMSTLLLAIADLAEDRVRRGAKFDGLEASQSFVDIRKTVDALATARE